MGDDGDAFDDEATHVVTAFLRARGEILLLRRSEAVGTYPGAWGGISGYAEGAPDEQVRAEIREETGLEASADGTPDRDGAADAPGDGGEAGADADVSLVRSGRPVRFEDEDLDREWVVHPYLFDCDGRGGVGGGGVESGGVGVESGGVGVESGGVGDGEDPARPAIELSEEHTGYAWVAPTAIATGEYDTVPELWTAYERVAPTVRSIAADDEHGAARLSVRALEVLRDRAGLLVRERADGGGDATGGEGTASGGDSIDEAVATDPADEWDELAALARRLLEARPSMAVLRNRVNRAMAEAVEAVHSGERDRSGDAAIAVDAARAGDAPGDARAVLEAAVAGIERAVDADAAAAARASELATGRVLSLSRSGTVLAALQAGDPDRVFVAESRPAREGVGVAEALSETCPVTVHTDAAAAHLLATESIDAVLVGADAVLPDGRVVNKTGTRGVAIAADREGVPVYAVAAADKVSTREAINLESGDRAAVYDGDAAVDVLNPTFDVTPANYVTGVVTERGVKDAEGVATVADELRPYESWSD